MRIAKKRQNEIGEEGWFRILEFLTDYSIKVHERYDKLIQGGGLNPKQQVQEKANHDKL